MASARRMTAQRASALLDLLAGKGHVDDRAAVEAFVLARQGETELPLYMRVLMGVGAALASVFFIGFLAAADLIQFDSPRGLFIAGLVFIAAAIGLHRLSGTAPAISGSFLLQTSFAAMAVGKVLFVTASDFLFDSEWSVSLAILLVTAATYRVYRLSMDRFLSSFAVLFSVLFNIITVDAVPLAREVLFNGFFAVKLVGAGVLLTHGRVSRDYVPVAYAFVFSLSATVLYLATPEQVGFVLGAGSFRPYVINALLTGGLIALFAWAAGSVAALKRQPSMVASLGAVVLGVVSAPGVMLSIGLMIFGYARHERLLLALGALLMPAFLCFYYYNVEASLLTKSLILVGSGVILLAGRVYVTHKVRGNAD